MIEMLVDWMKLQGWNPGFFRIFDYITFRVLMGALTALVVELLFGHSFIVFLYRKRFRDTGGEYLSLDTHSKRGTPTGGGLLIMLSAGIALILWGRIRNPYLAGAVTAFFYFGFVGWFDDWQKVRFK